MDDKYLKQATEEVASWPMAKLAADGIKLDRIDDNPEAARYFLAYADWDKVDPDVIFEQMADDTGQKTQVYVDFPYCPTVCNFCAFYGEVTKKADDMQRYVTSLKREIDILAERYFRPGFEAETLELGGGTPTHVPYDMLVDCVDHLLKSFPFAAGKEHNFEATPESIIGKDVNKLEYLRKAGFNRMSIGAQTFNDKLLQSINRPHGSKEIVEAVRNAQALDFERVNFDLMIGLVDQTLEDFFESVDKAVGLGVEVIEIYTMRYFDTKRHVPATMRLKQVQRFMDPEVILTGRLAVDRYLRSIGYKSSNGRTYQKGDETFYAHHYEENFKGNNVLGLGRKSHSNVYPWQYANYRNIEKYHAKLEQGVLPFAAGCLFDDRARLGKLITGALQLPVTWDYDAMKAAHPTVDPAPLDERIAAFERNGLVERDGGNVTTTRFGFFFVEEMLKVIFDASVTPFNAKTDFLGRGQAEKKPKLPAEARA